MSGSYKDEGGVTKYRLAAAEPRPSSAAANGTGANNLSSSTNRLLKPTASTTSACAALSLAQVSKSLLFGNKCPSLPILTYLVAVARPFRRGRNRLRRARRSPWPCPGCPTAVQVTALTPWSIPSLHNNHPLMYALVVPYTAARHQMRDSRAAAEHAVPLQAALHLVPQPLFPVLPPAAHDGSCGAPPAADCNVARRHEHGDPPQPSS